MRACNVVRFGAVGCLAGLLALVPACGGGGGSSAPSLPGALVALALQGNLAPDTGGGTFGVFPSQPAMSAATGNWSAFVAPISLGNTPLCLYVAQPDGTLVRVYAAGDQLPGGSAETITGFGRVFMCPGGLVVAHVTLGGGTRDFALVSGTVLGGIVTGRSLMIVDGQVLPAPVSAALTELYVAEALVADNGTAWFLAEAQGSSDEHLLSVPATGTPVLQHLSPGDALPNGVSVVTIDAFGLDRTGTQYAFVADTTASERRIYNSQPGAPSAVELAQEGTVLPGGAVVMDVHAGGSLIVYDVGNVVWLVEGNGAGTDHILVLANGVSRSIMARTGNPAPGTGPSGLLGTLHLLSQESQIRFPTFWTNPVSSSNGITFAIYGVINLSGVPALAMYNGRPLPASAGAGAFGTTFPGLGSPLYTQVSRNSDIVFANVFSTGSSGLFWLRTDVDLFAVALEGAAAPGGDTFGAFTPQAAFSIANDVVVFRAALAIAGTGIFRRG